MEKMETIDKTYLEEIKEAAREGAKEGVKESKLRRGNSVGAGILGTLLGKVLFAAIVIAAVIFAISVINPFPRLKEQLQFENGASEHDLVLENQGLLGYTAADFAEAVLGDQSKLCKLEVLRQEISDAGTLTETRLGNLKIFSKTQLITYHGTAVYTVDCPNWAGMISRLMTKRKRSPYTFRIRKWSPSISRARILNLEM